MTIHEAIHAFDINPSAGTDLEDYKPSSAPALIATTFTSVSEAIWD
jgi:hypothetical protein